MSDRIRLDFEDGWYAVFGEDGYTIFAPRDGACGWALSLEDAARKATEIQGEGLWR